MFKDALNQLLNGQDLSHDQMLAVMQQVMGGELTTAQISALLIALRLKGETVDEITAAATVMRELSNKVNIKDTAHLVDTCGTGGDGIQTLTSQRFLPLLQQPLVQKSRSMVVVQYRQLAVVLMCWKSWVLM